MPRSADRQGRVHLLPHVPVQSAGEARLCCNEAAGTEMLEENSCNKWSSPGTCCKHVYWHGTAGGWGRDVGSVAGIRSFAITLWIDFSLTGYLIESRRIKI